MEQSLENNTLMEAAEAYEQTKESQRRIIINAINCAIERGDSKTIIDIKGYELHPQLSGLLLLKGYNIDKKVFEIEVSWKPKKEEIEQKTKEFADKLPQMIQEKMEDEAAYAHGFKDLDNHSRVPDPEVLKEWQEQEIEDFKKIVDSDLGKWLIEELK